MGKNLSGYCDPRLTVASGMSGDEGLKGDRYSVEFNKWNVFVNDEQTRSFLALEVLGGGLSEITKQIHIVDVIYRLHGLPEFYKNPRPHISLLWGLGDTSDRLKQGLEEIDRCNKNASPSCGGHIFSCKTSGIECKI
ncbi:CBS domain, partial [Musa troglodytarum]